MTVKSSLIAILFFLLGAGAIYSYTQFQKSERVREDSLTNATLPPSPSPVMTNSPKTNSPDLATPEVTQQTASIQGTLGFPSEGIPPMKVYALNSSDPSKFYSVSTVVNQSSFVIPGVAPGLYQVVAYTQDGGSAGGYTQAVPCGLTVDCTDHSLILVSVEPGKNVSGVEVKDWYVPMNMFPPQPE